MTEPNTQQQQGEPTDQQQQPTEPQTPPTEPTQQPEVKNFTQEQLDAIVADRLAREKKKYADYEDIKTKYAELETQRKEKERSEMDELTRAQDILKEKDATLSTLQQQLAELQSAQKLNAVQSAFEKAALESNIPAKYLDDAKVLAGINADTDAAQVAEIVKTLVEAKPFLVENKTPQQRQIGDPTNGPQNKQLEKTKEQMLSEAADKARVTGRMEDKIAYVNLKRELGL